MGILSILRLFLSDVRIEQLSIRIVQFSQSYYKINHYMELIRGDHIYIVHLTPWKDGS